MPFKINHFFITDIFGIAILFVPSVSNPTDFRILDWVLLAMWPLLWYFSPSLRLSLRVPIELWCLGFSPPPLSWKLLRAWFIAYYLLFLTCSFLSCLSCLSSLVRSFFSGFSYWPVLSCRLCLWVTMFQSYFPSISIWFTFLAVASSPLIYL